MSFVILLFVSHTPYLFSLIYLLLVVWLYSSCLSFGTTGYSAAASRIEEAVVIPYCWCWRCPPVATLLQHSAVATVVAAVVVASLDELETVVVVGVVLAVDWVAADLAHSVAAVVVAAATVA